jgi:hypothetical protein
MKLEKYNFKLKYVLLSEILESETGYMYIYIYIYIYIHTYTI